MSLLGVHSLTKFYGSKLLFKEISFTISEGERIGFIGPNGSGKSTLLKILTGQENPDAGSISQRKNLRIGYSSQAPEFPSMTIEELLMANELGDETTLRTKARTLLGKTQFQDFSVNTKTLSGGWKKRLDIAKAMMKDPELLLLDEPTNHLDLEGILWLEKFLAKERCAYIIVSHDRYFLENTSNKIIELNPCYPQGLFICSGNMSEFMERKEDFLKAQRELQQGLSSNVRAEVEWLKRSPKARTTKSRARIQKAYEMIDELSELKKRNKVTQVDIEFSATERETRKLLVAKNIGKSMGGKELFKGIDITLSPGTRLGIAGRNGSGKTTLLKILAGMIPQDMGTLKYADEINLVYFDQMREQLPPDISLREALSPTNDRVSYRGQLIHVNGFAKKFLFSQDRMEMPIKCLSGGERARILIAKLMLKPADILFLDEPTNDLDISTLEVIEESLKEFEGAVVLISHDRCLMDRVCKQVLGLGTGHEENLFADLDQWERMLEMQEEKKEDQPKTVKQPSINKASKPTKLSYHEKRELEGIEGVILALESEIEEIKSKLESPEIQANANHSLELYRSLAEKEQKVEQLFERWQYLLSFG